MQHPFAPLPITQLPLCLADDKFKFLNKPKGNVEKFTFAFVSPKNGGKKIGIEVPNGAVAQRDEDWI